MQCREAEKRSTTKEDENALLVYLLLVYGRRTHTHTHTHTGPVPFFRQSLYIFCYFFLSVKVMCYTPPVTWAYAYVYQYVYYICMTAAFILFCYSRLGGYTPCNHPPPPKNQHLKICNDRTFLELEYIFKGV